MRNQSKKVYLRAYVPFTKYPTVHVPWIDVWAYYYVGRKKIRQMLTLKWTGDLDAQIEWVREHNLRMKKYIREEQDNPPLNRNFNPDWKAKEEWYDDQNTEIIDLEWAKEYFTKNPKEEFCIDDHSFNMEGGRTKIENGYFYILVNRPQLNKQDIEDGIQWYLKNHKDIKLPIKFRWKKCKRHIWPV